MRSEAASAVKGAATPGSWLTPDFDSIAPELRSVPNWVLAKAVTRDGKVTKPPFQPDGRPASHSNPATWSPFEDVRSAYLNGDYIGVGFVLDGKPHFDGRFLHGFDWDDCISHGVADPAVTAAIKRLSLPRVEISLSGTGVRAFFLHDKLLRSRKTRIDGRSVEMYGNLRYLTTTGLILGQRAALR